MNFIRDIIRLNPDGNTYIPTDAHKKVKQKAGSMVYNTVGIFKNKHDLQKFVRVDFDDIRIEEYYICLKNKDCSKKENQIKGKPTLDPIEDPIEISAINSFVNTLSTNYLASDKCGDTCHVYNPFKDSN